MADHAKIELKGVYSTSADFSSPKTNFRPSAYVPATGNVDEYFHMEVEADTGGTTVTTSLLSSAVLLIVKNNDGTNYVTATLRSAGNGSTDNLLRIAAGGFLATTDFTVANNLVLTANSAACECEVFLVGT
ncbi:hypothetical protein CMI37_24160 [Candidatus Pacearchaeota archaeon]|nr:hypothetical protein [Candidatus Pacearchaeota archaeon]|tara:strand:+ start:1097 stop:1489 length:393 start_codon:yes stop_codon:yes gene_type:complete